MTRNSRRNTLILFVAVLAVYLAFPTKDYYWDGVGFALAIDHPAAYGMIEGNHPAYIGFGWMFYEAVRYAFPAVRSLSVLQTINSIFAALSVCLIYSLGEALFASALTGLLLAGAFATAATWWKFATDANAYIPAIFFLLASARVLLVSAQPRPVRVAAFHFCAMLFHQLAALFFLPAALALYLHPANTDRRVRIRNAISYLALTAPVTMAAYYFCYYMATSDRAIGGYLRWIAQHTPDAAFSFSASRNLMFTLRGTLRVFFGGSLNLLKSGPFSIALMLALGALGFYGVRRIAAKLGAGFRPDFPRATMLVWIGAYAAFLFFWMPQNTFYRLFYLAPVVLLFGLTLKRPGSYAIAYALFALAASWNFLFYIYPHSRSETNKVLSAATAMHALWRPGTVIYDGSFNTDNWIISYFNPQAEFKLLDTSRLSQVDLELQELRQAGREGWLDQSAIDLLQLSEAGGHWIKSHTQPEVKYDFSDGKHRIRFTRAFPALSQ